MRGLFVLTSALLVAAQVAMPTFKANGVDPA
jgi:hypothetical protein